jgi:hypothetical protein
MKTKLIFSSLILSILLMSCKDDKKLDVKDEVVKSNNFEVELDIVIKQDDSLQVFYRDEAIPTFGEDNSIWIAVKGKNEVQTVNFVIPEPIVPTHLRFDLSKNEVQNPIVLNNFRMMFEGKSYEANDSTMVFFQTNDQLKYDVINKTLNQVKVEGQSYDPFISSTDLLTSKIKDFIK